MTSTDCFFLALEKHGDYRGASGSVCRYLMEFEDKLKFSELKPRLEACTALQWLLTLRIKRDKWLGIPYWQSTGTAPQLILNERRSDELIPKEVLSRGIDFESGERISFDLIQRSDGTSALILSWHHLLMDGQGAILLIQRINQSLASQEFIPVQHKRIKYTPVFFMRTVKMFLYYTALFWTPFIHKFRSGIKPTKSVDELHQKIKYIEFNKNETERIEKISVDHGSSLGMSSFFLASTAISIKSLLERRGNLMREFWVPVPQDQRKKGASGPIIGNHLSFLFYSMKNKGLNDLDKLVSSIQQQMKSQIAQEKPKVYDALMRGFRRLPTGLYYHLVKGSKGRSLASFLFTIAAKHPDQLNYFLGHKVIRALSLPPNTYPPGCTVAYMKHDEKLQIMLLYYEDIWSENEVTDLEQVLKDLLLGRSD